MPKSKIQAEFVKATKVDPDEFESRQDFLVAVVEKVNTFKDPQWDKLSEEAQDWINDAVKKVKAKKRVPEFADVGSVPADEDDEKPAKKKKAKAAEEDEEDEEEEAPKKKKKAKAAVEEDDEEEDDEDADDEDGEADDDEDEEEEEEEDEKPVKKKKAKPADDDEDEAPAKKKKKAKPADDEEDEEEDEPKPKKKKAKPADDEDDEKPAKKKKAAPTGEVTGVKVAIKTAIIEDPEITVDALIKKLSKGGAAVSKVTVSNVRSEFRHTLKTLKQLGKLKGVEI